MIRLCILNILLVRAALIEYNWATAHVKTAVNFIETVFPTGNLSAIVSKYYQPGFSYNITDQPTITNASDLLADFQNVYQGAVSIKNTFVNLWIVQPTFKVRDAGYYIVSYSDGTQMKVDYVRQWEVMTIPGARVDHETVDRHWNYPSTVQK